MVFEETFKEINMSKQSEAKIKQGFTKESPKCSNCKHFSSEILEEKTNYGTFQKEINMRCKLGTFKVGKSNYCNKHALVNN